MKVAIVHDWLGPMAGAERVLDQLLACHPGADVYTTIDFLPPEHRGVLRGARVTTSFLQHVPGVRTRYWSFIPLMPVAIERFDLSSYDLVISNSHTVAKGARTTRRQRHLCYLETPMRFAWDLEDYYLDQFRQRAARRLLARAVFAQMRRWDRRTAARVDRFVALSRFVAGRCERFYGRSADVLFPPVATEFFTPAPREPMRTSYLTASRLTPFKNIELIVEAFRLMPERRLVVVGDGPERDRIRQRCTPNVTMLGYLDDTGLRHQMRSARAFLFPAPEDFGLIMAEAQACGTPVVALGAGGALEIVRGPETDRPTGLFFPEATPASVVDAVEAFERTSGRFSSDACRANALRFASATFRDGWMRIVEQTLAAPESAG